MAKGQLAVAAENWIDGSGVERVHLNSEVRLWIEDLICSLVTVKLINPLLGYD
jgi:hypothetical protein